MRLDPTLKRPSRLVLAAWFLVCTIAGASLAQGPPPAAVRVDPARMESVQELRMVTGELRAVRMADVATQESGLVVHIGVQEGQVVKQGETLAKLESEALEIELRDVKAQELVAARLIEERRAELSWRERDLETYRELSQRQATNPKELYDAEALARIATARLAAAESELTVMQARADRLQKRIDDSTVTAPFDGVITRKHTELGEWLEIGDEVVNLVATGAVDAWLDVPQRYANAMLGKPITLTVQVEATGASLQSTSVRTVPQIDSKARTFSAIARLESESHILAPGMSVLSWVPTGITGDHLTISKNGVLRNDVGPYVYVARSSGAQGPSAAMPAPVEILFSINDRFVVRAPSIAPGDLIIVEGNERLFPTAPVMPTPVEPAVQIGEAQHGGSR